MAGNLSKIEETLSLSKIEQNSIMVPLSFGMGTLSHMDSTWLVDSLDVAVLTFEALKNTLMNVFNPIKGLEIHLIENGCILFNFTHTLDWQRVINSGPCFLKKKSAVLRALEEDDDPTTVDLNWVDFFVHVHGLSI
ncbi:UNVERIFIED_CONTAM: hypothetical protein Slati_0834900 [Sesamum latifolium]|uniref:DUF4283 domain-containing protein n=1 Tax=Sesamum latifolium TaxID=2727402 RepID=A0AAW2XLP5_9LAMI